MSDTRDKCPTCNGKGVDYGETCLQCGGQGRVPFREHGRENDEDQTLEERAADIGCDACAPTADSEGEKLAERFDILLRGSGPLAHHALVFDNKQLGILIAALRRAQPPQPSGPTQQRDPKECFSAFTAIKDAMPSGDVKELVERVLKVAGELQEKADWHNNVDDPNDIDFDEAKKLHDGSRALRSIVTCVVAADSRLADMTQKHFQEHKTRMLYEARVAELEALVMRVVMQADDLAKSVGLDRMHEAEDSLLADCRAALSNEQGER